MRQFVLENQNIKNGLITLSGKDFRYFRQVLRVKVGDMLNVRFPDGTLQNSTVAIIDDKTKIIKLQICANNGVLTDDFENKSITRGVQASEVETHLTNVEYWLFQFIPKPVKFEQIVKQATECGVAFIVPVIGEFSEKSSIASLEGAKKERLERIIKEARQQSGSPVDTKVLSPMKVEDAIEMWNENSSCGEKKSSSLAFVLSERDDCEKNLHNIVETTVKNKQNVSKVAVAVGSEGGISPLEVELLQKKGMFYPIHFAVNILRCETAALYGIAAVQTALNDVNETFVDDEIKTDLTVENENIVDDENLILEEEKWL